MVGQCYSITNAQVTSYMNAKCVRSSHLSKIDKCDNLEIQEISPEILGQLEGEEMEPAELTETDTITLRSVDEKSLNRNLVCTECASVITEQCSRFLKCPDCGTCNWHPRVEEKS